MTLLDLENGGLRTDLNTTMIVSTTIRRLRQNVEEDVQEVVEKGRTLTVNTREERKYAVQTFRLTRETKIC